MPTSGDGSDVLVDSSVALALLVEDHEDHSAVAAALSGRRLGLSGHAAFETFSVLTRLPGSARRAPGVVARLLDRNFPDSRFLPERQAGALLPRLAEIGVAGGQVYDGLVAATATAHGRTLVTRDARALETYRRVGASFELLA